MGKNRVIGGVTEELVELVEAWVWPKSTMYLYEIIKEWINNKIILLIK